nr:MAG TPA: hypothetical protein [Caudoviricetes sp.]
MQQLITYCQIKSFIIYLHNLTHKKLCIAYILS